MPRKQWAAFERVTAADVNATLADQAVMVFATTTARDAAIPSPTVGMESAVQASPDLGAPRFWDGSAWQLVQVGSATSAVWTRGNPDTSATESIQVTGLTLANAGWTQLTASMPVDALVTGFSVYGTDFLAYDNTEWRLGTGAAGSEVTHWGAFALSPDSTFNNRQGGSVVVPYGVAVASGQRLAIYYSTSSASPSLGNFSASIQYTRMIPAATPCEGSTTAFVSNGSSTAWVQVATTPPLSAGVWVIGFSSTGSAANTLQFGLGGSGSEVAATPYRGVFRNGRPSEVYVPPFFWPSSTRLAYRTSTANNADVAATWRETLT
jgi:hypothetical protein